MNQSGLLQIPLRQPLTSASSSAAAAASCRSSRANKPATSRSFVCDHSCAPTWLSPQLPTLRPSPAACRTVLSASAGFSPAAPDDFRSTELNVTNTASPDLAARVARSRGLSGLAARIVFGTALGVAGALVILTGGWCYMICACFIAYQASQEYFGFLTSKVGTAHSLPLSAQWHCQTIVNSRPDNACPLGASARSITLREVSWTTVEHSSGTSCALRSMQSSTSVAGPC